jgi:hypothetical protein
MNAADPLEVERRALRDALAEWHKATGGLPPALVAKALVSTQLHGQRPCCLNEDEFNTIRAAGITWPMP